MGGATHAGGPPGGLTPARFSSHGKHIVITFHLNVRVAQNCLNCCIFSISLSAKFLVCHESDLPHHYARPFRSHPVPCSCARRHETQPKSRHRRSPRSGEPWSCPHRSFWPISCPPIPLNGAPCMCRRCHLSGLRGLVIGVSDHRRLEPPRCRRLNGCCPP